jgi:hypothetical protein
LSKERILIPEDVASEVMFLSNRTCCVCREKGKAVQIHHLDEDPSNNSKDNLAVLCLECHNQTQIRGGFGRKLNKPIIEKYRDDWYSKVKESREVFLKYYAEAMGEKLPLSASSKAQVSAVGYLTLQIDEKQRAIDFSNFKAKMNVIKAKAVRDFYKGAESGVTSKQMQAGYDYINVIEGILIRLGYFFEECPDGFSSWEEYFSDEVQRLFSFYRVLKEAIAPGGTIVGPLACTDVMSNLENTIVEMVHALCLRFEYDNKDSFKDWESVWSSIG